MVPLRHASPCFCNQLPKELRMPADRKDLSLSSDLTHVSSSFCHHQWPPSPSITPLSLLLQAQNLVFFTNLFLHSSSTFPPTKLTSWTLAFFVFLGHVGFDFSIVRQNLSSAHKIIANQHHRRIILLVIQGNTGITRLSRRWNFCSSCDARLFCWWKTTLHLMEWFNCSVGKAASTGAPSLKTTQIASWLEGKGSSTLKTSISVTLSQSHGKTQFVWQACYQQTQLTWPDRWGSSPDFLTSMRYNVSEFATVIRC